MKKRALIFILALTTLTAVIWLTGEILIGIFINSYGVSLAWAILCAVACLAYSAWKCPRDPVEDDEEDDEE